MGIGAILSIYYTDLTPSEKGTPIDARNLLRAWYLALRDAGVERIRYHDLRHMCGTRLASAGVDISAIARILDHSQLSTTRRYARHHEEDLRKNLGLLDRKNIFGQVRPHASVTV